MKSHELQFPRRDLFTTKQPFFGFDGTSHPGTFGLAPKPRRTRATSSLPRLSLHEGGSHLLSVGATGSGKTNMLIANLLLYEGSAIVVDLRGDAARATAHFRRTVLNQDTYVCDPFGVSGFKTNRLDPTDIATLPNIEVESESQTIASTLSSDHLSMRDPYWHVQAGSLIASTIAYLLTQPDPAKRSMSHLIDLLFADDTVYTLAVLLDTVVKKGTFAYEGIAAFLQLPDSQANTRFCVLSTAQSMLHAFRSSSVRNAMGPSDIPLGDLLTGKPMTIYLALPIERMASHGVVLKLWLEVLLQVLMRRSSTPALPTWVMVDEAAQIGPCAAIKTVATYLRANGVRLWTMWQDISQIRALYPTDWQTLVNNTSALTFMPGNALGARELAAIAGVNPTLLSDLELDEQLVCEVGHEPHVVRMAKYWKDRQFEGRYQTPPRYL